MRSDTSHFPNPERLLHNKLRSSPTLALFRGLSIQRVSSKSKLSSNFGAIYSSSAQYVKVHDAKKNKPL